MVFPYVLAVLALLAIAQSIRLARKGDTQPLILLIVGVGLMAVLWLLYSGT